MGDMLPSLKYQWSVVYFFKNQWNVWKSVHISYNVYTSLYHALGKPVLKEENTMSQTLFSLYMLMSSNLKNIFYKELLMYTSKNITALPTSPPLTLVNRMGVFLFFYNWISWDIAENGFNFFEFLNIWQCMDCADKEVVLGSWLTAVWLFFF